MPPSSKRAPPAGRLSFIHREVSEDPGCSVIIEGREILMFERLGVSLRSF